jgi:hypothetical protein
MNPAGFPHSDIPGSKIVCVSPRLIAAYHVLHRLLVPRHPPCALSSLTGILTKMLGATYPASHIRLSKIVRSAQALRAVTSASQLLRRAIYNGSANETPAEPSLISGGDSGARTRSLRLAKPALSQLSYIPEAAPAAEDNAGRELGGPGWTRTTHLTLIRRAL